MKMRVKRRMRTRPREWIVAASVPCKPYTIRIYGIEIPMTSRRVRFSFYMQHAGHSDCLRKIKQIVEAAERQMGEEQ